MEGWNIKSETEVHPQSPPSSSKFIFKEAEADNKIVITIWGMKGEGKTSTAFGLPGTKSVICMDYKAQTIKENFFKGDTTIKIYNGVEYLVKDQEHYLDSASETYDYITFLLDNIQKEKTDWVVIDGLEILHTICEMVMRKNHGIRAYQGIQNLNVWKERKQLLDGIHNKAMSCVRKGIVYTTYCEEDKIIESGAIITSKKVPKWTDTVLFVTDVVLHVESQMDKDENKIILKVNSSKIPGFLKTGDIIDITGKKLSDLIKV